MGSGNLRFADEATMLEKLKVQTNESGLSLNFHLCFSFGASLLTRLHL